jgi:hypothetical protein
VVFEQTIPGTETPTGTTYGTVTPGTGGQGGVYFMRLNGATGDRSTPKLIDPTDFTAGKGHQFWADVSADGGVVHLIWYDSRNDPCYSPTRTDVSSNPNYEQFSGRTVPFLGGYIWVSSIGETAFAVWTDYRNTVPGTDVREAADDDTDPGADVLQCRDVLPDGSITATSARATAVSIRTSTET